VPRVTAPPTSTDQIIAQPGRINPVALAGLSFLLALSLITIFRRQNS